jgi:hypothetical protein
MCFIDRDNTENFIFRQANASLNFSYYFRWLLPSWPWRPAGTPTSLVVKSNMHCDPNTHAHRPYGQFPTLFWQDSSGEAHGAFFA